jgi:hypothetical protein
MIYFSEWIDRWLMGDVVPGPGAVQGHQFEVWCGVPSAVVELAERSGHQFQEQQWLAARLQEAALAWQPLIGKTVVVVIREVLDSSATDEEVTASSQRIPGWLAQFEVDAVP